MIITNLNKETETNQDHSPLKKKDFPFKKERFSGVEKSKKRLFEKNQKDLEENKSETPIGKNNVKYSKNKGNK